MSRINYEIADEKLIAAWRTHVLAVHGSQRGGAALMAQAMKEFLQKNGALPE